MQKARDELRVFGPPIGTSVPAFASDIIRGKPFQADYEETHIRKSTSEVERRWGSLAQDSEGRRREDNFFRDPEDPTTARQVTIIWEPKTMTYCFIDHKTNQVRKLEIGAMVKPQARGNAKPEAAPPEPHVLTADAPPRTPPSLWARN